MNVSRIAVDDARGWADALRDIPHAVTHTHDYCAAIHRSTGRPTFLLVIHDGPSRAVCPLSERPAGATVDLVTPYGLAGFATTPLAPDLAGGLGALAAAEGYVCAYVGQHPLFASLAEAAGGLVIEEKFLHVMDLRPSLDEVFARMSTNRRRQVAAAKAGVVVVDGEARAFLVDEYGSFMNRKDAAEVYRFSRDTLEQLAAAPSVFTIGVRGPDGDVEAAAMFGVTRACGEYLFGLSSGQGARHSTVLIWSAVERLKALGVPWLHLGGGVRGGDTLDEYKRRFGTTRLPLRSLRMVFDEGRYRDLCARVGADPEDRTGWFPPYHRPGALPR